MRWRRGEAEIERLLAADELRRIPATDLDGAAWLDTARRVLAAAAVVPDPGTGVVTAYDAARRACVGLLAQQGLRATTRGGHYAIERAVVAQFDGPFAAFGPLRRTRNDVEYPERPGEDLGAADVARAIAVAESVVDAVERLLPEVGLF